MTSIETVLLAFKEDYGRWPRTSEGLTALIRRPADVTERQWRGPYVRVEVAPKDPWGHDYMYRSPGSRDPNRFDLYSLGPEGVSRSGGYDADDISLPQGRMSKY